MVFISILLKVLEDRHGQPVQLRDGDQEQENID